MRRRPRALPRARRASRTNKSRPDFRGDPSGALSPPMSLAIASGLTGDPTTMERPQMTTSDTPRAGRREWIGLTVLSLACLLYVMDLTVLHLAVPANQRGPEAEQRPAALDHRHLRVHGRWLPH